MDDDAPEMDVAKPFKISDIDRVLTSVSGGLAANLRQHVMKAVDISLRDNLGDVVSLSSLAALGTPQVMIRVRTLQTILDEFRRLLAPKYTSILEHVDLNIGFNFGVSLIKTLRNANSIPLDFSALLGFWARFDSTAQMGHFSFDFHLKDTGEAVVETTIKQLFVTLGYGQDEPLRHSSLMVGYLVGAADTASLLWTRWLRASVYENPPRAWCAAKCVSGNHDRDGVTTFSLELREERSPGVRDRLVLAIEACEAGNGVKAMIDARMCLEESMLRIAGHSKETRFSFGRLLEQLQNVRADINYGKWKTAYDTCSGFAHQAGVHNEVEILGYLFYVWECVREAEGIELSDEQKANLLGRKDKYVLP
jgi:hypothetical protein